MILKCRLTSDHSKQTIWYNSFATRNDSDTGGNDNGQKVKYANL